MNFTPTDHRQPSHLTFLLVLFAIAIASRAGAIGNPAIHMDEQFYLLVADQMWSGALPYVDVWDRKPIGLFLIYAFFRPLSSNGIVAYQIGALIFATATAFIITRLAAMRTSSAASLAAGCLYLVALPLLGGVGGQSPVFYNLPVTLAAFIIVRASKIRRPADLRWHGFVPMLLIGIAIQIKYTVFIEGMSFGFWLLYLHRKKQPSIVSLFLNAITWVAAALLPTIAAMLFYASIGHLTDFVDANFRSIFLVRAPVGFSYLPFLQYTLLALTPLIIATLAAVSRFVWSRDIDRFLLLWLFSAAIGFVALGSFYNHHALPLLVPMSLSITPLLSSRLIGTLIFFSTACWGGSLPYLSDAAIRTTTEARVESLTKAIGPMARSECLYINDGPTILYLTSHACTVTPYLFPEHLNNRAENDAVGAAGALQALLARRPAVIMVADRPLDHPRNPITVAMLNQTLVYDYYLAARLPDIYEGRHQLIYKRRTSTGR